MSSSEIYRLITSISQRLSQLTLKLEQQGLWVPQPSKVSIADVRNGKLSFYVVIR
jgi:hypothetical protein